MRNPLKQKGAAIIVALFVTSLVAIAAVAMIVRLRLDVHRTELLLNSTQAELYAKGSLYWAIEQLNNDLKEFQQEPNKLTDKTPIHSPAQTVNAMTISTTIYDAQGRFNLNNLIDAKNKPDLVKLILTVAPKTSRTDAENIALAVSDWVSPVTTHNALTDYYLKLKPPYHPAHRLMLSVSELRLVKGVTPALFAALSPYVTALPEPTPININNTSAAALMSASPTLPLESATTLVTQARKNPFTNPFAFAALDIVRNNNLSNDKITLQSHYFLVKTDVKVGQQRLTTYTLLQRKGDPIKPSEAVIWQSKGTL